MSEKPICPTCQNPIKEDDLVCSKCGHDLLADLEEKGVGSGTGLLNLTREEEVHLEADMMDDIFEAEVNDDAVDPIPADDNDPGHPRKDASGKD